MSPHAVNSFVSDLVTMAQAMERLPVIEHELSAANAEVHDWKSRYDLLALDLEQSRAYAAKLESAVHDAEVAKDAAETMFLQADDRTMRAVEFIKAQFGAAGSLIQALEPERAKAPIEETVQPYSMEEALADPSKRHDMFPEAEYYQPQVSEVKPIPADPTAMNANAGEMKSEQTSATSSATEDVTSATGQSEPGPTAGSTVESFAETSASPVADAHGSTSWASPTKPQPYAGLSYQDYPRYVSYNDWIEGGGTSDTYYYPLHKAE